MTIYNLIYKYYLYRINRNINRNEVLLLKAKILAKRLGVDKDEP